MSHGSESSGNIHPPSDPIGAMPWQLEEAADWRADHLHGATPSLQSAYASGEARGARIAPNSTRHRTDQADDPTHAPAALPATQADTETQVDQLGDIFEGATDGLLIFDAQGELVRTNAAARRILGLDAAPPNYAQLSVRERLHLHPAHDERGRLLAPEETPLARVLSGEVLSGAQDLKVRTLDGREVDLNVCAAPLRDREGRLVGVVSILREQTERKWLERSLSEREQLFRTTFEQAAVGMAHVGPDGRWLRFNQRLCDIVGYSRDELAAKTFQSITHPDDLDASVDAMRRLLAGECDIYAAEKRYVRKDGTRVWVDLTVSLIRTSAGDPDYFVTVVQDISARKRLEREREEARAEAERQAEQLHRIFEGLTDGVVVYDAQGLTVRTNAAVRCILGLDAAPPGYEHMPLSERLALYQMRDAQGRPLAPADAPSSRALRGEVLTRQDAVDLRLRSLDGREVEVSSSAAPLHDRDGRLVGAVNILRDQTERNRLEREREEALRSSEEWFRTMADTAPVLLWVAGTDALVTFVNASWLRFTGRRLEQELGNGWTESIHPDDAHRCGETYLTAFRSRQSFTLEYRLRRHDGEYRWVVDTGVPRFAPDGSFLGYIGSAIDISDHKRLEREREEARADEVAVREVNRHMDQFLATAAHDLRSPITGVVMGVELAQRRVQRLAAAAAGVPPQPLPAGERPTGQLDEARAALHALERANQAVQRLSRLVVALFDLAQARTGSLELTPAPCDLAALVREQVEAQRLAAPHRALRLQLPRDRPVPVVADRDRIGQVVTNYLTNALKYSAEDQPVAVTLEVEACQARVVVRDAGPGLPPEEQARVWEPYHRAPGIAAQGESEAKGSLGLGLHICKTIVEGHGGQVGVESAVGQGSSFWFTIPLAPSSDAIAAPGQ